MKKIKNKKAILIIGFAILLMFALPTKSKAATLTISTSKSTVSPGESFTVTVTLQNGAGKISSGGQTQWLDNSSFSYTKTAGESDVEITASGVAADYATGNDENVGSSAIVKVASNTNSNNTTTTTTTTPMLTNLGINPYDFSGFRSNNTSYSVNVPNDCTSITVYATGNGTITGTGTKTLKEGTNRFDVTVTTNGSSKTYSISAIRATADGEDVPNVPENEEEENQEEESEGIVLENLEIEGYKLDPEFNKKTTEYTVKVNKKFTSLDEIKQLVKPTFNDSNYTVEVTTEADLKDDNNVITVIIRDDEKEYSRYTITFVYETSAEQEIKPRSKSQVKSDNVKMVNIFGIEVEEGLVPVFVIVACTFIAIIIALILGIIAYIKSRKLRKYEEYEEDEDDEEEDNTNYIGLENPYKYNYKETTDEQEQETKEEPQTQEYTEEKPEPEPKQKRTKRTGKHF